jgi:hypothetical protein
MPNYNIILKKFVENQKRAIDSRYYDLDPREIIKKSALILCRWITGIYEKMVLFIKKLYSHEKLG